MYNLTTCIPSPCMYIAYAHHIHHHHVYTQQHVPLLTMYTLLTIYALTCSPCLVYPLTIHSSPLVLRAFRNCRWFHKLIIIEQNFFEISWKLNKIKWWQQDDAMMTLTTTIVMMMTMTFWTSCLQFVTGDFQTEIETSFVYFLISVNPCIDCLCTFFALLYNATPRAHTWFLISVRVGNVKIDWLIETKSTNKYYSSTTPLQGANHCSNVSPYCH